MTNLRSTKIFSYFEVYSEPERVDLLLLVEVDADDVVAAGNECLVVVGVV